MAYYHHLLRDTKPQFASPAKVFAMLKSKVEKEGTFTANDSSCDVKENHGAVVMSPRKKTAQSTWRTDKENQRSASHQASDLSPQKTFRYPGISSKHVEEMPPPPVTGHGYYTPRKRAFPESTTLPHLSSPLNRPHIHTQPPYGDSRGGFKVISRTPVKTQPVENDFVSGVFEEGCAPQDKQMSHAYVLSPMRKRLKKSTWEMQEFNTVSSSTKEVNNESIGQPREKKTSSAFTEDNITCMDSHLGNVRGFPAYPSGMTFTHEPVFPSPRPTAMKRCHVALVKLPLSSPAKIFAYMKERESKTKQQEVHKVSRSTKDLFDEGNFHQSRDMPPSSTAHNMGEMEDIACRSLVPVNRSRVESAESSQSDTYPSEDVPSPALSPQAVLLEDSLILKTPRISIPKKQEAVFKRSKWPTSTKFPCDSTIYLKKWFLRKNNRGLFVDGIHRDDNIPWNSNIIVERVSNSVVKTVSGSVYILVGKMNMTDSELPKWLLKMFAHGFPRDWKALYERLLSRQETERNNKGRSLEASSMIRSVRQHKKKPVKTPASCPPASVSRVNVSRSGRVIKPPLEYWRGGRVILDAQMNVTIHECYDTSIYTPVTTRASQKPARVFLPCSEGRKQSESASNEEASVPLRRVKAPLRKRNSAEPEKKPSYSSEPPVETLGSPEEWSDRPTRSSRRRPAAERALYVDTVPQKQSEPEKSSTRRSKRQTHNTARPSVRVLGSKRAAPASASSSDDEVIGRKKQGKEVHGKKSGSQPCYVYPSSSEQSESDSDEEASVPLRRVKSSLRKLNSAMVKPEGKPSYSSEPPVERLSSPEEWSDRPTRSSRRRPAAERALYVDTVPQKQSEPEKSSTRRSKRQTHTTTRPSVRLLGSKRAVPASASSSDDEVIGRKKPGKEVHGKKSGRVLNESRPCYVYPSSESPQSSDEFEKELGKRTRITQTRQSKCIKSSSSSSSQSSKKKPNAHKGNALIPQEQDADEWTEAELMKLQEAVSYYPNHMAGYWAKVAKMVGTRSAEECHYQHTSKVVFNTPVKRAKRAKKPQKEKVEAPKVQDLPVISSGVGTYKRKHQVRQFLEAMPREDVEDVFSSAYMQNKRFEMPSMCPSDHDFTTSGMEHLSPMSTGCAGAKTPQCLHLTPGMMGSPNRNNGDKYVYQLQKRMKKNQFNVCKQGPPSKSFTPTPSVKRTMRRCGNTENDTFFVWEMFPGKDGALSESGEEEDFYFSDND